MSKQNEKVKKNNIEEVKKLSITDVCRMNESLKTTDFEEVKNGVKKYYYTIATKIGR